jgi:cytoskeleton protein RodZ
VPSFGAQLRREREQRKVTLDDISSATKIGTRFLRAIEDDHFEQLPGGIFNKGFVRAYARYLGLDEEQIVSNFLVASGAESTMRPEQAAEAQAVAAQKLRISYEEEEPASKIPWGTAAVLLLVTALALAIWAFNSREAERRVSQPRESPKSATPQTTQASSPPTTTVQPAAQETQASGPEQPAVQPAAAPPATTEPAEQQPPAGNFVVMLKARDDSWISATVDGSPVPGETLVAESQKSFTAHRQVVIRAGNSGMLDVYFNGQKLPRQGDEGQVKTLTFDAQGLRSAGAQPTPAEAISPN